MAKSGEEVVYEGWLTKSPPTKRIWRARWRRRWFSLKHSRDIPNQYILTYYADRNCRKLKGYINLDECEQVDLGLKLEKRKLKFDHVFDIKTPTRTYYLAADTENEMKSWVNCICNVCGLKSSSDEEDLNNAIDIIYEEEKDDKTQISNCETPPVSPVSTSPYIPISECITGKTPILTPQDLKTLVEYNMRNTLTKPPTHTQNNQTYGISQPTYLNCMGDGLPDPRFYDCPRSHSYIQQENEPNNKKGGNSPLQSPTDNDSVFTDDDMADVNVVVTEKFTKKSQPPPRPPKSSHVALAPTNYINLSTPPGKDDERRSQGVITDEMYDFPRSHIVQEQDAAVRALLQKRHCYNNAAPVKVEGQVFRYDISPKPSTSQVFRYDEEAGEEPASPLSQTSSTTAYSNLPSPLLNEQLMPPPAVNRELKPKRKLSDSLSSCSNPEPGSPRGAPSVDRKLKPPTPQRGAPSPILGRSHESLLSQPDEPIYWKMQYLDLDLDAGPAAGSNGGVTAKISGGNTVYKKVDFEKTEAFNITRNNLEKERNEPSLLLKK